MIITIIMSRRELKINVCYNYDKKPKEWNNIKNKACKIYNYTCCFCAGKFTKYMYGIHIDGDHTNYDVNNVDVCCYMCNMIIGINQCHKSIVLYYSNKPQKDIVTETLTFIRKYDRVPYPHEIDNDIMVSPITLLEYIGIIVSGLDNLFPNYKVFFTQGMSIDFVRANFGKKFKFNTNSSSDGEPNKKKLRIQKLSHDQQAVLKIIYD